MKLNIGDKAPVFQGKDQDGNDVNLENFLGKKVVLYFYPNDDTRIQIKVSMKCTVCG